MANDMIFLQISILPIDIVILIYIKIKYGGTNRVSPYFTAFCLQVTLGTALDSIVGFMDSLHLSSLGVLPLILTALDHFIGESVTYSFQRYATSFIGSEKYQHSRLEKVTKVLSIVYPLLLIANAFFGFAYAYEDGVYVRHALWFPVVFVIPLVHLSVGINHLFRYRKNFRREQLATLYSGFAISFACMFLQVAFFRNVLLIFYMASLNVLLFLLTFETPDYSAMMDALNELKGSQEREKEEREKADAAVRSQNNFMTQMSHEIRTPLNAIIGYDDLILKNTDRSEEIGEYAENIKTSANSLLDFFKSVMDYVSNRGADEINAQPPSVAKFREMSVVVPPTVRKTGRFSDLVVKPGSPEQRILIVDDNDMNVDLLIRMLKPAGIPMDTETNGKDALDRLRRTHYTLVFMDHMMPVMDGMEALRVIRATHICDDTPVIMMTANTVKGEEEKYRTAGFADYVTKPFEEAKLYSILTKYLPLQENVSEETWSGDMWDFYGSIFSFLDVNGVRDRFNGDHEFFLHTVQDMVDRDISPDLSTTYEDRNFYQYSCLLQALRENSELIGAHDVANIARTCRGFADSGDLQSLSVVHPQMKAAAAALHSRLKDGLLKMDAMGKGAE